MCKNVNGGGVESSVWREFSDDWGRLAVTCIYIGILKSSVLRSRNSWLCFSVLDPDFLQFHVSFDSETVDLSFISFMHGSAQIYSTGSEFFNLNSDVYGSVADPDLGGSVFDPGLQICTGQARFLPRSALGKFFCKFMNS